MARTPLGNQLSAKFGFDSGTLQFDDDSRIDGQARIQASPVTSDKRRQRARQIDAFICECGA